MDVTKYKTFFKRFSVSSLLIWKNLKLELLLLLFGILSLFNFHTQVNSQYLVKSAIPGGVYKEGIIGSIDYINPLIVDSGAVNTLNTLIFSGLTRVGEHQDIQPDLATSWEISPDNRNYTFYLRQGVYFHDGVEFNSSDIAFTIDAIQNPDTRSPYNVSWLGIKTEIIDNYTIKIILPKSLDNFLSITTQPILPRHIFDSVDPKNIKSINFNTNPIGTGPYQIEKFLPALGQIYLKKNSNYFQGEPKISEIQIIYYANNAKALDGLKRREVHAIANAPMQLIKDRFIESNFQIDKHHQTSYIALFYNTANPSLNLNLRKYLDSNIDRNELLNKTGLTEYATVARSPILAGFNLFDNGAMFSSFDEVMPKPDNLDKINLEIVTSQNEELGSIADQIAKIWQGLGLKVEVKKIDSTTLQQDHIRPRNYQILLYGQSLGLDADVYNYWHESQIADPGLNLSNYNNAEANKALESIRVSSNFEQKKNRAKIFLNNWFSDTPATILYSSLYVNVVPKNLKMSEQNIITNSSDHYYNVWKWTINSRLQAKPVLE